MKHKPTSISPPPLPRRNSSTRKPIKPIPCQPLDSPKISKTKNKSVELTSRKRKVSLQIKTKFNISSDHLGFLIQQQKVTDLNIIRSNVALNHYYQSLLSLFAVLYSSAQIITSNLFQTKKQTLGLSGVKFIGIIFRIYQYVWNQANMIKLRIMARNVMKMGSTVNLFQEKVQFICRKVTLNYNMRRRIEMSFLNYKLSSFWQTLIQKFPYTQQIQMLDDMYETAPQKMAYWDFSYFLNNYLSDQRFYQIIKQSNKYRRIQNVEQDTLPHNFTYQFVIIQIFCFHQEQINREQDQNEQKEQNQKDCQII